MQRATLATIATRSWRVHGAELTGAEVVALYHAAPDRRAMVEAVGGCYWMSERRFDRATKALKKAGLLTYDREAKQWRKVGQ